MSALNYSRFDHIGDDDSDNDIDQGTQMPTEMMGHHPANLVSSSSSSVSSGGRGSSSSSSSSSGGVGHGHGACLPGTDGSPQLVPPHQVEHLLPTIASNQAPQKMTQKGKEGRYRFEHEGRLIYEWDQSLEEVNIYVEPPQGIPRHLYDIEISHKHLRVGLKDTPPFIDEDTWGPVKSKESFWTLSDGELNINLQKMNKAEAWEAALVGRAGQEIDAFTKEEVKRKIMLERFQEEHPGFDFSGAEFNGAIPNAQEFMGGVKRTF